MTTIFSACRSSDNQQVTEKFQYENFEDIPGVTKEDIEGIKRLQESGASFTYAMNHSTEAFLDGENEVDGYSKYFCEWVSKLLGLEFTPIIVEWDELIEGLETNDIDFTGELTATDERKEKYLMTDAIAERSLKYFMLDDGKTLQEKVKAGTIKYAFLDGATSYGYISDASQENFKPFFVDSYDEAVEMLRNHTIDAFFEDGSAEAAFGEYDDIVAREYYPLIYTSVSLTTNNEELEPIINVVNAALSEGAILELSSLYNEGLGLFTHAKFLNGLTKSEREYINENAGTKTIKVGAEYDNYPISFYNKNENEWQGIAFDVLEEVSNVTGLKYEVINDPDVDFEALSQNLYDGEFDLLTELVETRERRGKFLWPSTPYCTDSFALISKSEAENIKANQIIYSKVAVQKGTVHEETFNEWFPDHKYKYVYDSMDECFEAIEDGTADYVMASRNAMLSMTNYNENPGYKMNIVFDRRFDSTFGLNKEERTLTNIISKAQVLVDLESIENNWVHKVFDYRGKMARERIPFLVGLAILLLLLLMLLLRLADKNRREAVKLDKLVKQRTVELEKQTIAAKEASKAKGEFLSRMSHEIRTPLNAIIGMAEIEKEIDNLPQKAVDSNREILIASNHLLGLINDVLDMSKIENGNFEIEKKPFAIKGAIEEIGSMIYFRCEEKKLSFSAVYDEVPDIIIIGDKLRLKQVLINLLANAIKFTDKGGEITLTVKSKIEKDNGILLHFSVRDTGSGISEEMRSRLFNPFEQDANGIINNTGTGLGLSISQNLIKGMGGEIKVDSIMNEGSNFYFDVAFEKSKLTVDEMSVKEIPDLTGKNILVAEDVPVNRMIVQELLKKTNINIRMTEDGCDALNHFKESEDGYFDIIFMDIQMPNMDGYTATREIRNLDRNDAKEIPIIAMTAFAYQEDVNRALKSGMTEHMSKPLDVNVLWRILSSNLV